MGKTSRFWDALMEGDEALVKELLQSDLELAQAKAPKRLYRESQEVDEGATALHVAAGNGLARAAKWLIVAAGRVDTVTSAGRTPLHYAARAGHVRTVKLLIDQHAKMNVADTQGRTALHLAAAGGHDPTALVLLEAGAKTGADNHARTPLHYAAQGTCEQTIHWLVEGAAAVDATDDRQRTALHLVLVSGDHTVYERVSPGGQKKQQRIERIVKYLLEHGANANARDSMGQTPLDLLRQVQGEAEGGRIEALLLGRGEKGQAAAGVREHRRPAAIALSGDEQEQARGEAPASEDEPSGEHPPGGNTARRIALTHQGLVIGRDASCDVRLSSRAISRRHAHITFADGRYVIEDLGSRNGVELDGQRVEGRQALSEGQTITLGTSVFRFDGQGLVSLGDHESKKSNGAKGSA